MKFSRIELPGSRVLYGSTITPSLILAFLILMAARFSLSRSVHFCLKPSSFSPSSTRNLLRQCSSCPLWSSSFSLCLHTFHKSNSPRKSITVRSFSPSPVSISGHPSKMSMPSDENPLLNGFDFPPFDVIEAKHVRPGIRALLKQAVCFVFSCK